MPGKSSTRKRATTDDRVAELRKRLAKAIPNPQCELDFETPWQLLIATILSAQSTDRTINRVTPDLFARYPTPAALAEAPREEVEVAVKSTGFFRNKAKAIQGASAKLVEEHGGEVPADLEALMDLPGVARKTATLVLGTAMGVRAGMTIDTHAGRVARRLELTTEKDPVKVERDLCEVFPRRGWTDASHRMILHGRYVCLARAPKCAQCPLNELCPESGEDPEGTWNARARREQALVESRGESE